MYTKKYVYKQKETQIIGNIAKRDEYKPSNGNRYAICSNIPMRFLGTKRFPKEGSLSINSVLCLI